LAIYLNRVYGNLLYLGFMANYPTWVLWESTQPSIWGLWESKLPGVYDNLLYLGLMGIYSTHGVIGILPYLGVNEVLLFLRFMGIYLPGVNGNLPIHSLWQFTLLEVYSNLLYLRFMTIYSI